MMPATRRVFLADGDALVLTAELVEPAEQENKVAKVLFTEPHL